MVGDGAVDGVAVAGWFDGLDVSSTFAGPRLRAAWATGRSRQPEGSNVCLTLARRVTASRPAGFVPLATFLVPGGLPTVYLLYLDESGLHSSPYFVLAGLAVFETHTGPLSSEVDRVLDHYLPALARVEPLRATAVRSGSKPPWMQLSQGRRWSLLDEAYEVIRNSHAVLFGVAIERTWLPAGEDEYLFAIESVARRFDGYLQRRACVEAVAQRGIIVAAESQFRQRIETLALRIQQEGTRWGEVGNLAEVPLFTSAANSRMLQLADLCANAIHARYATGHARHFDRIAARFDVTDGVFHGLWHASRDYQTCPCPGCLTRRIAGQEEAART